VAHGFFVEPGFPISTIFENLEQGATIDDILEWYQGLNRQQIQEEVVAFAAHSAQAETGALLNVDSL